MSLVSLETGDTKTMINLACHNPTVEKVGQTNETILEELTKAGITPVSSPKVRESEVATNYTGKYKDFTFTRAWYYWVVEGPVPFTTAQKMYENPNGRKDVRASGHCGCPPPVDMLTRIDNKTGKIVVDNEEWEKGKHIFRNMPDSLKSWITEYIPEKDSEGFSEFVTSYHIDSQEGLNMFMTILKEDGI